MPAVPYKIPIGGLNTLRTIVLDALQMRGGGEAAFFMMIFMSFAMVTPF
jgi:hypothetical protein